MQYEEGMQPPRLDIGTLFYIQNPLLFKFYKT